MTPEDLTGIRRKLNALLQDLKHIQRDVWIAEWELENLVCKMGGGEDDSQG